MKGKRAKTPVDPIHRITFAEKERVLVTLDKETFPGRVRRMGEAGVIVVRLDPMNGEEKGDLVRVKRGQLAHQMCKYHGCDQHATKRDGLCDGCREKTQQAMQGGQERHPLREDGIKWKKDNTHFSFETSDGVRFYGWYRKTRQRNSDAIAHCMDVYAKRTMPTGEVKDVAVESLVYLSADPRGNIRSLNADLIALANKWYFQRLNGRAETLDELVKKSTKPVIRIKTMEAMDTMILRLQEYRAASLHSGGERYLELKGDGDDPPVGVVINLSAQAFALKGKVPRVGRGVSADAARGSGRGVKGGDVKVRQVVHTASSGNVDDLMKALSAAKDAGDKGTCRQIRATLRQMGIKGGLRGYNASK